MTESKLTSEERELLEQVVARRDPALRTLVRDVAAGRLLTTAEAVALRDAVGDELAKSGIDESFGAVNERGKRLDELIDRIGALSSMYDTT